MNCFRTLVLFLFGLLSYSSTVFAQPTGLIRLNQIGFYPEAPKVAVVVGDSGVDFYITTPDQADTVFSGTLGEPKVWVSSQETVQLADFSALQTPGEYVLAVPGIGVSYRFEIKEAVHQEVARAALKAFYYQRASMRLDAAHAGIWARPAGHPDTRVRIHPSAATESRPANSEISAPGGWYDAGDFNKYIVNSGITVGTLLMLYEHFPAYYDALNLNIPESGNGVPDLLDEVLWNLRWMLAMQDPEDGGVYHKLTSPNFSGMVMPHQDTSVRYVVQKSTPAALDFAAVTAMAARIYDAYPEELPGLADSLLTASLAAWNWAVQNPNVPYDQNRINQEFNPDINTGEYGDRNFLDEFRWAAAELFITTGQDSFIVRHNPLDEPANYLATPGWPNVGTMGIFSLAHHADAVASVVDVGEVRRRILNRANGLVGDKDRSAYGVVMGATPGEFYWGSNSNAANQGIILLQAYRLTGERRFLDAALSNLDYLLGRNATGYSFVTGHGDKTPMKPHHRQSAGDQITAPVPGLIVGGPNPGREDRGDCPAYPSTIAASAYIDHVCSYASNEIAINWNAPFAYLAGAIEAIFSPTGMPVSVEDAGELPAGRDAETALRVFPNPIQGSATITFVLDRSTSATLTLYDVLGRRVVDVWRQDNATAGSHTVSFDAGSLPGGAYVLRLSTPTATAATLLTIIR